MKNKEILDLEKELGSEFLDFVNSLQPEVAERLNVRLSIDDGMYSNNGNYYLKCGQDALRLIQQCMKIAGKNKNEVSQVLDYGCGYGRVTRWLAAEFPNSDVVGLDIDAKALNSCNEIQKIDVRKADPYLVESIGLSFDLIWVGSLFTHVKKTYARKLLKYLSSHLTLGGGLVFTTHGKYVVERIRTAEKTYNLNSIEQSKLLNGFEKSGYGFGCYPHSDEYGISVCTSTSIENLIEKTDLTHLMFEERGWVNHQDCIGAINR